MAIIVTIIFLGGGILYIGYKYYKAYYEIELSNIKFGYKTQCENIPSNIFKRGLWDGLIIDNNYLYTDGAHNIIPYDFIICRMVIYPNSTPRLKSNCIVYNGIRLGIICHINSICIIRN